MTAESLKEYLSMVVDLETHIYAQEMVAEHLTEDILNFPIPAPLSPPTPPQIPGLSRGICIAMGLSLYFCLFIGIIFAFMEPAQAIVDAMPKFLYYMIALPAIPGVFCIFGVPVYIYKIIRYFTNTAKARKEYEQQLIRHEEAVRMVDSIIADKQRERDVLEDKLFRIKETTASERATLEKLYDKDIIFVKYRNFPSVCSLYEYIRSGRCDRLEGHEGAYNILETELRLDRIVTRLDDVIEHLEDIQENQYTLYEAVRESISISRALLASSIETNAQLDKLNLTADKIYDSVDSIRRNMSISAYCTARANRETEYLRWFVAG